MGCELIWLRFVQNPRHMGYKFQLGYILIAERGRQKNRAICKEHAKRNLITLFHVERSEGIAFGFDLSDEVKEPSIQMPARTQSTHLIDFSFTARIYAQLVHEFNDFGWIGPISRRRKVSAIATAAFLGTSDGNLIVCRASRNGIDKQSPFAEFKRDPVVGVGTHGDVRWILQQLTTTYDNSRASFRQSISF